VLRRYVREDWLAEEPDIAMREAATHALLTGSSVNAPALIAADPDARFCDVPAMLVTYLPGRVRLSPRNIGSYVDQMAEALVPVHALNWRAVSPVVAYFPYVAPDRLLVPPWTAVPHLYRRLIDILRSSPAPASEDCFLHRDYHPGNVLWSRGRLSAIIDWANACHGPPGFCVAYCEGNLAELFGLDAAERFRRRYEALTGRVTHPYWQLAAFSDHMPDARSNDNRPPSGGQWLSLGRADLTTELLVARSDAYLQRILDRYDASSPMIRA
jgi:aminoglycoside/choline kinase family phosphotransferase